ncbi:MAG: CsgG/HfaB family protein [Capsulimonadaceae bacterium]|nr:CsgG/HfaB family protein [Capsulimonadaceae bacterium]
MKVRLDESHAAVVFALLATLLICSSSVAADAAEASPAEAPASVPLAAAQPIPVDNRLRYPVSLDSGHWDALKTDTWSLPPDVQAGIQAQLAGKLTSTGSCLVVDRDAMPSRGGSDKPTAGVIGTGGFVVATNVVSFRATGGGNTGVDLGLVKVGQKKDTTAVTLSLRIVDAQTGQTIDSGTVTGTYISHYSPNSPGLKGTSFGMLEFSTSPQGLALDKALDMVAARVVMRLMKEPWIALVAAQDKNTGRIIINAGDLAGVQPGLILDVLRASQPVIDPLTGRKISDGDQVKVGRIKIARVDHYAAYADVVDGKDFQPRDLVEPAAQ